VNLTLPKLPFSLPLPDLPTLPPMPSFVPSGKDFVNEASETVNADLQQTLNTAVENAKTNLVAAGEAIVKNFYERALSLVIIFVVCLATLLILAFLVKLIRDAIKRKKDSLDIPPQTV